MNSNVNINVKCVFLGAFFFMGYLVSLELVVFILCLIQIYLFFS